MNFQKQKQFAALLSIFSNSILIIMKFMVGITTGSISIISEAVHSFSDLIASFMAFFSVKKSAEPADEKHQYGHGKFEDFSGLFEGLLIVAAAFYIVYKSVLKLNNLAEYPVETTAGIVVMAASAVINIVISKYLFKIGKKTDSIALIADAQHLSTDVLTSLGVLVGLVLIKITGYTIIDPLIAFFVAILILKTALSLCYNATQNLLDGSLPSYEKNLIEKIIEKYKPDQVATIESLRTRKSGHQKLIELTLTVHQNFTIKQGHDLCNVIEKDIKKVVKNSIVTIHLEPCGKDCNICK